MKHCWLTEMRQVKEKATAKHSLQISSSVAKATVCLDFFSSGTAKIGRPTILTIYIPFYLDRIIGLMIIDLTAAVSWSRLRGVKSHRTKKYLIYLELEWNGALFISINGGLLSAKFLYVSNRTLFMSNWGEDSPGRKAWPRLTLSPIS